MSEASTPSPHSPAGARSTGRVERTEVAGSEGSGEAPLVVLHDVHGRDAQGLGARPLGKLHGVSLSLAAELVLIEGSPADGTTALCELLSGRRAPSRGRVRVAGRSPHRSPRLRSRIGALLPQPALPLGFGSATSLLAMVAGRQRAEALLDALALQALGPRPLASLGPPEQRAVELALCLMIAQPLLLVLDEPLATLCDHLALQQLLRTRVDEGCCVVVTSRNGEQLHGVGRRLVLEQGELREPPAQVTAGLWVQLADAAAARQLAQRLLAHQALASLQLELGEHDATLTLRGAELSVLSRAVTDIVLDGQLPLLQVQPLHHPAAVAEVPHG